MTKRNRIIYWIATTWLSLGMVSTAIVQWIQMKEEVDLFNHLGYPLYFMKMLAVFKILGVVTILIPKFPVLKEWAYAGFFFSMMGALLSHMAMGDAAKDMFGPVLLLLLIAVSWYFRPTERRMVSVNL